MLGLRGSRARTEHLSSLILYTLAVLLWKVRSHPAKNQEQPEKDHGKDDDLAHSGVGLAILGPLATSLTSVILELVSSKLVINETSKSDAVSEKLNTADWVTENEHRGNYEEDVLENAGKCENEGRSLADL